MHISNWKMTLTTGWALLALVGCSGTPGVDGKNGADGTNGSDGADGTNGADGTDGINGTDGADGTDGTDGTDAIVPHMGEAPWGVNLEVVSVDGATGAGGAFQVGDIPEITYTVLDDDGVSYAPSDLSKIYFNMSGPTTHPQIVEWYQDITDVATASVDNNDGTYTYSFINPIPATYHAVPNDTTDLGEDDGDWGGLALVDGTYTIGGVAYLTITDPDGTSWYDTDNTTSQVLFGAATALEQNEVVLAENCASCHGDTFRMHGGSRQTLDICLTCHVDGGEDRYSGTDGTVTPGVTIGMTSMVHKIHNGDELANGYEVAGYPGDSTAEGYPNYNLTDYSDVAFPSWPLGAAHCDSCHEGAADGDVEANPSRLACGACHDTLNFVTGENHDGGAQADDSNCHICHSSTAIAGYHDDPRTDSSVWSHNGHASSKTGLNVTMLTATNQDGASAFQVGDTITVTFSVLYDDGTPIPQSFFAYSSSSSTCPTVSGAGTAVLVGPSDYMQRILYSPSAGSTTTVGSVYGSSTVDTTTGIWTYTLQDTAGVAQTIPSTFPYQYNVSDTTYDVTTDDSLYGQDLESGTYRIEVLLYTAMWEDTTCANGSDTTERWRIAEPSYIDVAVGDATTIEPHDVVTNESCEACHDEIRFHGGTRSGVEYCVTCHTRGSTDARSTPPTGVYFAEMVHSIHGSATILTNEYTVNGSGFDVTFPRQDGGVATCTSCHGDNTAWQSASEHACITCHNSDADHGHAAINTDETYGETCDVCHGAAAEFSVESVHEFTR